MAVFKSAWTDLLWLVKSVKNKQWQNWLNDTTCTFSQAYQCTDRQKDHLEDSRGLQKKIKIKLSLALYEWQILNLHFTLHLSEIHLLLFIHTCIDAVKHLYQFSIFSHLAAACTESHPQLIYFPLISAYAAAAFNTPKSLVSKQKIVPVVLHCPF